MNIVKVDLFQNDSQIVFHLPLSRFGPANQWTKEISQVDHGSQKGFTAYFTQVGDDTFVTGEGLDGITRLVNTKGSEVFASSIDSNSDLRAVNFKPTIDADGDGFVDGVSNYQIYNNDTPFDLTNKKGRKFSDKSSRMWDAVKAITTDSSIQVLIEGTGKKNGKFRMWFANPESGKIASQSNWKKESWMSSQGFENIFDYDINDNGVVGF